MLPSPECLQDSRRIRWHDGDCRALNRRVETSNLPAKSTKGVRRRMVRVSLRYGFKSCLPDTLKALIFLGKPMRVRVFAFGV
jgi:hypothetical protein